MYRYIIVTAEQCDTILAQIESIMCIGYSRVMQTGDTYYIPIYSADDALIPYESISYDDFTSNYWQEPMEEPNETR